MAKSDISEKLKKRPDGRFVKTVTDERTGKRVFIYGKSEREINKNMLSYSQKAATGRVFNDVSGEWWAETEDKLALQSVRTYKQALKRAEAEFKKTPIKNITPYEVDSFLRKVAKKGYAQNTVSNQKMVLNLIFERAVLQRDIMYNPCASVSIPKNLPKSKREEASAEDEKIVHESTDVWLFPFVALMTGMRKGEILALQWGDIDFTNNIISITKSVCHDGDKPVIKSPKTAAGNRMVPLLAPLKEKLLTIEKRDPSEYLISDDGKTPLTEKRFTTLSDRFKKHTGVKCTAHQLRHSFATIAFECGLSPKVVQEILGHKQLSTTMDIYTDFRKKALDSAAEVLNKGMTEGKETVKE